MNIAISYISALVVLLFLDYLWLGILAKDFYRSHIGHLFREDMFWPAIAAFYLFYSVAIIYFAVWPAEGDLSVAFLSGLLLGFTAYMTYDLVNIATLKSWPWKIVLIDIAWGSLITGVASLVSTLVLKI